MFSVTLSNVYYTTNPLCRFTDSSCFSILSNSPFISSLTWMEYFLGAWIRERWSGFRARLYSPLKCPIRSNWSGYEFVSLLVEFIRARVFWIAQCMLIRSKSLSEGNPIIVGPSVVTTKNLSVVHLPLYTHCMQTGPCCDIFELL